MVPVADATGMNESTSSSFRLVVSSPLNKERAMKRSSSGAVIVRVISVAVWAAVSALGCGDEASQDIDLEGAVGAIQGGQLETGYPAVGMLQYMTPDGERICTGTLISQSWVLSAAHCAGTSIRFRTGTGWANFVDHAVDQQITHPKLDQALFHLVSPISGTTPLKLNEGAVPPVGTICTIVGFGDNGPPATATNGIKRSATSRITFVSSSEVDITWQTGISDGGDSGGPLLCNGVIVATDKGHDDGDFPQHQSSIYKPVDPAWTASNVGPVYTELTLQNGWTNAPFSTRNASAAIVSGAVQLKGAIATTGANAVPFTLPAAFRPEKDVYVPVDLCGGKKGSLLIKPTGVTTVRAAGAWSDAQCFTSLEGVTYAPVISGYSPIFLQNGWINGPSSTNSAQLRTIGGIVHMRGAISSGTTSAPFTLSAEYRPAAHVYAPVTLCNSKKGRLHISPSGSVIIEAEGAFSDAQCMTSLDGVTYALDGTGFTSLAPQNGWTGAPFSTGSPGVTLVNGVVHFRGGLATSGANMTPFTLPAAFRPPTFVLVPVDLCGSFKGRLTIAPSGVVTVAAEGALSNAQCFTSLDGASYTLSDFTPLTLDNGLASGGFATGSAGFRISDGIVQLKGGLSTTGTSNIPFLLPPEARPPVDLYLPISLCDAAKGRLFIGTNGGASISVDGPWSKAQCFSSLEGVSYALSTSGYTALTLTNGWTNAPFSTRNAVGKDIGGIVHLAGTIGGGTSSGVFQLPAALRPSSLVYVPVDLCGGKKGRLNIAADGTTAVQADGDFSDAQCFTSLEGVTFAKAAGSFVVLPLLNGWTNAPFNTRNVAAWNDKGIIRLQGAVASGTTAPPFVLPTDMRPTVVTYVQADLCAAKKGRVMVDVDGSVTIQNGEGTFAATAQCFTSLEGIALPLGR